MAQRVANPRAVNEPHFQTNMTVAGSVRSSAARVDYQGPTNRESTNSLLIETPHPLSVSR
jgi:hypothetical protein